MFIEEFSILVVEHKENGFLFSAVSADEVYCLLMCRLNLAASDEKSVPILPSTTPFSSISMMSVARWPDRPSGSWLKLR